MIRYDIIYNIMVLYDIEDNVKKIELMYNNKIEIISQVSILSSGMVAKN